jgi:acyl carrier protein phosphodiesterase
MNWLAHLILSEPTSAFRIGNLLPDILPGSEMHTLPAMFQAGIECHRAIDRFTDLHPIFMRSRRRLEPPYRRYGGILIDIFYDHFLARAWSQYSTTPLDQFIAEIHASFPAHRSDLPLRAYTRLIEIQAGDWLLSYRDLNGVRRALDGIGSRLRKPQALGEGTAQLELHYDDLRDDFVQFFPELSRHVEERRQK